MHMQCCGGISLRLDQGRIQDFKLEGADLKKLRRAEGGAKMFWVFRVENHDFTPKNHIFSNFRRGGGACRVRPSWIRPCRLPKKFSVVYLWTVHPPRLDIQSRKFLRKTGDTEQKISSEAYSQPD